MLNSLRPLICLSVMVALNCAASGLSLAADRETKVRDDRKLLGQDDHWIYNDLPKAFAEAKRTGKPLLVVFRCIPCEACSNFDEMVVAREPRIRRLMDQFVCVRVPQANGMDLSLYQFDYDMSLAMFLMRADGTIYGRFGTRSGQKDEDHEMTIDGLGKALSRGLEMHEEFEMFAPQLAGKKGAAAAIATPEEHPSLKGKYTDKLNYEGNVVKSCIHCHQIREAQRMTLRDAGKAIPDDLLFPWPNPSVLGFRLDPNECATVKEITPGSPAEAAGLQAGDELLVIGGQRPISIADVQWVLHTAKDGSELKVVARRGGSKGEMRPLAISLTPGWRRQANISWRATTWDLRRQALGGMVLEVATPEQREALKLPADKLALHVKYVGQYNEHARAKQAGFQKGDIVIEFDGDTTPQTEGQLIATTVNRKKAGDKVSVKIARGEQRLTLVLPIQ